MSVETISLAQAKARLSELTDRIAQGDTVIITKRGKPVARVSRPEPLRKPLPQNRLRQLTDSMPPCSQSTEQFMRTLREDARY